MELTRDLIVSVRRGIYNLLVGAISQGLKSDEHYVSAILSGIDGILNYSVNTKPTVVYINGVRYASDTDDSFIVIYEGVRVMFVIYQDKADSKLKVHCLENDLKTDKELMLEEVEEEHRLELENEEKNERRHQQNPYNPCPENESDSTDFNPFRYI